MLSHSLHNVQEHPSSTPLIINLPPFPNNNFNDVDSYLPSFLHHFPTATIHYRWTDRRGGLDSLTPPHNPSKALSRYRPTPFHWPTPIHDTMFGYEWLIKNLSRKPSLKRRAVYVYGSYLGASLATSLALTESHTHEPMAVRGLLAFNGIYNWSRMLPGHPTNQKILEDADALHPSSGDDAGPGDEHDRDVAPMRELTPTLFRNPSDLFDPFASPVLFFHTAGMLVPSSFTGPASYRYPGEDVDDYAYVYSDPEDPPPPTPYEAGEEDEAEQDEDGAGDTDSSTLRSARANGPFAQPRKGYFAFPPRTSSLKIPETLLLHSTSTASPPPEGQGRRRALARQERQRKAENSFEAHALGLAHLMRKSVNRMELREKMMWDMDTGGLAGEAGRRVGVADIGMVMRDGAGRIGECGLGDKGEEIALRWLEDRGA